MRPTTLRIVIDTDDDAFHPDAGSELARILRELADSLEEGPDYRVSWELFDVNGNTVGTVTRD